VSETLESSRTRQELPLWLIRSVVAVAAAVSAVLALIADTEPLPRVALGQTYLYKLEVLLLIFYGLLLLATPLLQGVLNGRLPTEITARGAKYDPEEVSASLKDAEGRVTEIEGALRSTTGETFSLRAELARLEQRLAELEGSAEDRR
jgi:hypothetical protein